MRTLNNTFSVPKIKGIKKERKCNKKPCLFPETFHQSSFNKFLNTFLFKPQTKSGLTKNITNNDDKCVYLRKPKM